MKTKTILITLITMLAVTALLFQACNKDNYPGNQKQLEMLFFEQGFPEDNGIITTIELDGIEIECEKIDSIYIYQGDIVIKTNKGKSTDGAGIIGTQKRWPDKIIYYVINDNLPDKDRITEAITHWTNNTSLIFLQRQDEPDYIEIVWDQNGCWSYLGMIGGRQEIHIADWGTTGTVIHEIGHAIGLIHEQSKPNRDDEVIIKWDNIQDGKSHNFSIHTNSVFIEDFDYNSIMLYSSYAFTRNNYPTITKNDGSTYTTQRDNLSLNDIQIVEDMYATTICGQANLTYGGQTYEIVEIGNQCWMAENLNYETANSWWYDNNSANGDVFGRLYTWEAALTACPNGWHLPTDDEIKTMETHLGMSQSQADETGFRGTDEGGKMKEVGTTHWYSPNTGASNSSGFKALPGGSRVGEHSSSLGYHGNYWSSSEFPEFSGTHGWYRYLRYDNDQVYRYGNLKKEGLSVRCLKN